jgi:putative transferase (TIGR04331 family)
MEKIKTYLICTNLKETFPNNKNSIINFVSEAALKKYPNKEFSFKEFYITKNQWTNKEKLLKDFEYLDKIYESLLPKISNFLNEIHNCNFSEKFWRILIGPWLGIFIYTLYDRWKNLKSSVDNYQINKVIKLNLTEENYIPYDNSEFLEFIQNENWNQYLYQSMFSEFFNSSEIEEPKSFDEKEFIIKKTSKNNKNPNFFKQKIFDIFNLIPRKNYKYLLYSTYTGFWNELKLSIRLKQLPIFGIEKNKYKTKKKIDKKLRFKLLNFFDPNDKFQNFLHKSIIAQIPKVFIENYQDLVKFSKIENLPKEPEKIVTANALWFDSFFTFFVAKMAEKKSKIIYIQHGGAYGISGYSWVEEHEKKISDKYLSWGWTDEKFQSRVKKFYVILKNKKFNWNEKKMKNLLILMRPRKVYFQTPETSSVGIDSYSEYINFYNKFFNSVSLDIKNKIILRFPFRNLKRESFDYFSNLNQFKIDESSSFENACNKSKLVINTANSTTFCETIANEIPSVLIINKNTPIRKNILPIIENMKLNNLIFYDVNKAAIFINEVWKSGIKDWWFNKDTQRSLNLFKENLARPTKNISDELLKEIKSN